MKFICKIRESIRKMGFLKRTCLSLGIGFLATLLFAVLFETAYYWMASHTNIVVAAGLILSQVALYKADIDKVLAAHGASADSTEEAERQPAPKSEATNEAHEGDSMGDDFAVDGEKSDDDETPERFEDD